MLLIFNALGAFLMVLSHATATASEASRKHGTQHAATNPRSLPARVVFGTEVPKLGPVLFVVGDDVGYGDFGYFNDQKTITPTVDKLLATGIHLADYYTFKICSPSRAAMMTGRYPWAAGFYDMKADTDHCTVNSTALPEMLKPLGCERRSQPVLSFAPCHKPLTMRDVLRATSDYFRVPNDCVRSDRTHALGKWDIGFLEKKCSATYRGFDSFFGYYTACEADYWYHGASGGYPNGSPNCTRPNMGVGGDPTDLSNNSGTNLHPAAKSLNGTYNTALFAQEAARLVRLHDVKDPFYMYLAFMAVHDGCTGATFKGLGKQAPLATVDLYNRTVLDTYKVAGAMYTELDRGIQTVIDALQEKKMWDQTVLIFVSDNGGPLDHCTNSPLRGGKHTFLEGGVRVMSFISGPLIPTARRGTRWTGMAASADWYKIIVEGIAGGTVPANSGTRPPDALNLWPAILDGSAGPRTEVVHQVENQYICDTTQAGGGCCSSMRMGEMKLIIGGPGDSRTLAIPEQCTPKPVVNGYKAPCPLGEFVEGCVFECGDTANCEECMNNTEPVLITPTAEACQAACAKHQQCAAFQWIGVGDNESATTRHHQCLFKCAGAVTPGRTQCSLGHAMGTAGGSFICGPKRNNSNAPAPPGPPPPAKPTGPPCPVPFGLTGGTVEAGTDHARAGNTGAPRHDLVCKPWCLFNLTADIGERDDLGQNPAYQGIAETIAARLKYHGSTGPPPAYIWPDLDVWSAKVNDMCEASLNSGALEPLDVATLE